MSKRSLAMLWPLFAPKPKSETESSRSREWNQEANAFRHGHGERHETARERLERLSPQLGDLKRLVL